MESRKIKILFTIGGIFLALPLFSLLVFKLYGGVSCRNYLSELHTLYCSTIAFFGMEVPFWASIFVAVFFFDAGIVLLIKRVNGFARWGKIALSVTVTLVLFCGSVVLAVSVEEKKPFYKVTARLFREAVKEVLPDRRPKTCREEPCPRPVNIPESVSNRYAQFKNELFRSISWCKKGSSEIYRVGGGGGFTGTIFYFDGKGNQTATESFTDVVTPDTPPPPVNLYGYTCSLLSESMPSLPPNSTVLQ